MRLIGDSCVLCPIAWIHNSGDPAQSASGVSRRDCRQTTVRRATNRAGVQTCVLPFRPGADVVRTFASRASLPSTSRRDDLPDGTVRSSRQLRRLSFRVIITKFFIIYYVDILYLAAFITYRKPIYYYDIPIMMTYYTRTTEII